MGLLASPGAHFSSWGAAISGLTGRRFTGDLADSLNEKVVLIPFQENVETEHLTSPKQVPIMVTSVSNSRTGPQ